MRKKITKRLNTNFVKYLLVIYLLRNLLNKIYIYSFTSIRRKVQQESEGQETISQNCRAAISRCDKKFFEATPLFRFPGRFWPRAGYSKRFPREQMLVISVFNLEPSLHILGSFSLRHSRSLLTLSSHVYTAMFASVHGIGVSHRAHPALLFFVLSLPRLKSYSIEPIFFDCVP